MSKNRIIGAIAALSLLAVPAVAAAHGSSDHGHHHGRHHHHQHHAKKARDITGAATGTIASFTDGALTITLPSGRSFTADVTKRTILECRTAPVSATAARHGGDDNDGDNSGPGKGGRDDGADHDVNDDHGDHATTTAPASTTAPSTTVPAPTTGDDGPNHDAGDDHGVRCGTDALVAGAKVTDARLALKGADAVWKKVELLK